MLASVRPEDNRNRLIFLGNLAAVLYRAGRYHSALARFNERLERLGSHGESSDWVFLAMIHHRLGHPAEARQWLGKLGDARRPDQTALNFWDDLELELLRAEARALIVLDPVFPADPFQSDVNRAP